MNGLDRWTERVSRRFAQQGSRRSFLRRFGLLLVGAPALPLLPVSRAEAAAAVPKAPQEAGDPTQCDYWRYCAIDGFLCDCCGGSYSSCPPGTEMSPITWIGTCRNPADDRNYMISYNDCCGKSACGACQCSRDEGDRPAYRSDRTNDVNWCLGTQSAVYHCSTALVIGVAIEP